VVVQECLALGMDRAELACEYARNRGCLASEALDQVNHFKAHPAAWGIGLLYKIIEHLRPEKKVQWPEPSEKYRKAREAELKRERDAKTAKKAIESRSRNALAKKQSCDLERQFGETLDAMSLEDIASFLTVNKPDLIAGVPDSVPIPKGLFRLAMLSELESVAKRPELVS